MMKPGSLHELKAQIFSWIPYHLHSVEKNKILIMVSENVIPDFMLIFMRNCYFVSKLWNYQMWANRFIDTKILKLK